MKSRSRHTHEPPLSIKPRSPVLVATLLCCALACDGTKGEPRRPAPAAAGAGPSTAASVPAVLATPGGRPAPLDPTEIFRRASHSVVAIKTASGQGSGVVVAPGQVLTNRHVIGVAMVMYQNKAQWQARLTWVHPTEDLAVVTADNLDLPVAERREGTISVGERVYAIGAPQGFQLSMSEGLVSGLRDFGGEGVLVQTTAAISPGSSGGGLFDAYGRLIGITTSKWRGGENMNFALPASWASAALLTNPQAISSVPLTLARPDEQRAGPAGVRIPAEFRFSSTGINVDFREAAFSELTDLITGLTGIPFVVDPAAGGTVTLRADDMPWEEVLYRATVGSGRDYSIDRSRRFVRVFRPPPGAQPVAQPLGAFRSELVAGGEQELPQQLMHLFDTGVFVTGQMVVSRGPLAGRRITFENPTAWHISLLRFRKPSGEPCEYVGSAPAGEKHGFFSTADVGCEPHEFVGARGSLPATR